MPHDVPPLETDLELPAPYEQQPGESAAHFGWFCAFLEMGTARSVLGAYKNFSKASGKVQTSSDKIEKFKRAPPQWHQVEKKWNWRGRVGAWDKLRREERWRQFGDRESAVIDQMYANIETRLERRSEANKLAKFILSYTPYQHTTVDGQTVIEPGKWDFMTGVRALKVIGETDKGILEILALLRKFEQDRMMEQRFVDLEADIESESLALERESASPTQLREKENARLDTLEILALAQVQAGVPGAMERAIRIAQRRAHLNGLDKPFDKGSEEVPKKRRDLSRFSDVELALMEEMFGEDES